MGDQQRRLPVFSKTEVKNKEEPLWRLVVAVLPVRGGAYATSSDLASLQTDGLSGVKSVVFCSPLPGV